MSTITIGRCGLTQSTGVTPGPNVIPHTENQVGFSGWIHSTAAKKQRQQLIGLVDSPDEPIVPITFSADTSYNGFYRVESASVDLGPNQPAYPWSAQCRRVTGYQAPIHEIRVRGAARTNVHGIDSTEVRPWVAVPRAARSFSDSFVSGAAVTARPAADGSTAFVFYFSTGPNSTWYLDATPRYSIDSSAYYDAACTIKIADKVTVGRQIENKSTDWELTNSVVSVKPATTAGALTISHWDGSSWDRKVWRLGFVVGSTLFTDFDVSPHTVTALRNSPEQASLRLEYAETSDLGSTTAPYPIVVDLGIRRGGVFVEGYLVTTPSAKWAVRPSTMETISTAAMTGAAVASAADSGGNKLVVAAPSSFSIVSTKGWLYRTISSTDFAFGIGSVVAGATSTGSFGTADGIARQYYAAQYERQKVGVR